MTLDELIKQTINARATGVPGNTVIMRPDHSPLDLIETANLEFASTSDDQRVIVVR